MDKGPSSRFAQILRMRGKLLLPAEAAAAEATRRRAAEFRRLTNPSQEDVAAAAAAIARGVESFERGPPQPSRRALTDDERRILAAGIVTAGQRARNELPGDDTPRDAHGRALDPNSMAAKIVNLAKELRRRDWR
jgi:hypothetical protein